MDRSLCKTDIIFIPRLTYKRKGLFRLDCQRQFDSVKHDALVSEHIFINRSIHTGRIALGWVSIDAVLGRMAGLMNGARLTAPIGNRVNGKPALYFLYNRDSVDLTLARPI